MKELIRKITRASGRISDIIPLTAVLSFFIAILGSVLGTILMKFAQPLLEALAGNDDVAAFMANYGSTIGTWIATLLFIVIFKRNRPMLKGLAHDGCGNSFKSFGIGLLLGFSCNAICVLISWLCGDIKLSFFGFDPILLLAFFLVVFIQSSSEELLMRLYAYQKLRRRYKSPLVAVIVNSIVFTLMHGFNPGFTWIAGMQIGVIALIFSLFIYYYNALWAAMAFHTAWNYTQNIIFGLPNSGIVSAYSLFNLEAASARDGLFYNVNFGVEGSIGSTLILLVILAAVLWLNKGKSEKSDLWSQMEQEEELKRQQKEAEKQEA